MTHNATSGPVDAAHHRRLAVDLFNHVWTLLEKGERTRDEDEAMIHAAHASRHHWGEVGEPKNWAIGEWQLSRVYATLGRAEPAVHHARRGLELCANHGLGDYILAYAHEAMARAYSIVGDTEGRTRHAAAARQVEVAEAETRKMLESDLAGL